jgi:hypothetical protein
LAFAGLCAVVPPVLLKASFGLFHVLDISQGLHLWVFVRLCRVVPWAIPKAPFSDLTYLKLLSSSIDIIFNQLGLFARLCMVVPWAILKALLRL